MYLLMRPKGSVNHNLQVVLCHLEELQMNWKKDEKNLKSITDVASVSPAFATKCRKGRALFFFPFSLLLFVFTSAIQVCWKLGSSKRSSFLITADRSCSWDPFWRLFWWAPPGDPNCNYDDDCRSCCSSSCCATRSFAAVGDPVLPAASMTGDGCWALLNEALHLLQSPISHFWTCCRGGNLGSWIHFDWRFFCFEASHGSKWSWTPLPAQDTGSGIKKDLGTWARRSGFDKHIMRNLI